jgi:hypothetical protein
MSGPRSDLERECRVFTRFLIARRPEPYVVAKYAAAHAAIDLDPADRLERFVLRLARLGTIGTLMADAWARFFAPRSALRKKLVLLLAILETCNPSARELDAVPLPAGKLVVLRLAWRGLLFLLGLIAGSLLLLPARLLLGRGSDGS